MTDSSVHTGLPDGSCSTAVRKRFVPTPNTTLYLCRPARDIKVRFRLDIHLFQYDHRWMLFPDRLWGWLLVKGRTGVIAQRSPLPYQGSGLRRPVWGGGGGGGGSTETDTSNNEHLTHLREKHLGFVWVPVGKCQGWVDEEEHPLTHRQKTQTYMIDNSELTYYNDNKLNNDANMLRTVPPFKHEIEEKYLSLMQLCKYFPAISWVEGGGSRDSTAEYTSNY